MALLLEVKNLSVCVKKGKNIFKIIDDISFTLEEGKILGIAGESGCGKTITALSIPGLLPKALYISEGDIIFNGKSLVSASVEEMNKIRGSEISFVFQDVKQALNPLMKAGKQITETLELGGSKDKNVNKTKALEMLLSLGFSNPIRVYNAFPHQLSGGMCQRIMTAIAAIRQPKLLLGDEPSSSLDEESQEKCLSLLNEMNKNCKTSLLIISHDLSIIQKFCNRFLIMYAGKIMEEGPAHALFSPLHPYTQALVNSAPAKEKRGQKLENIPGRVPTIEDRINGCPFAPRCIKAKDICKEAFPPAMEIEDRKIYCFFPEK
jgi:oligopeptide/dipeptide ABC transporter ATP-binding protein